MITKYAGPGGWNDPDMLQIGNGQLTLEEQRSHFSLWAALKAPLLLGFDAIALNEEIIAINQDPLGLSVSIVQRTRFYDIWTGPLSDGYVAVLFNRGEIPVVITLYFASHCNLEVPKHGVTVLKLTGGSRINKHNEPLFLQHIWDEDIVDDDPIEIDISINGDQIY
ncbi:26011_t:CDS:2 [Gigaspora margarita]|uniref:Alpha-galactosidase n=1 Tax=Gigaspora margarita TaxID=4874 RepID=A0ABM8W537_GIGMA|nr:26011_t:CDS:2 [Gigaspora margarita]